jgi:D-amino-acid oxidase
LGYHHDTDIYLDYLMRRFQGQGGRIEPRAIVDLVEAFAQSAVVANCSGLGARELVHDADLYPSRGQVVRIRHNGFRRALPDDEAPGEVSYIVPRTHDIVLGGTDEEYNESAAIDPADTQAILRRCAKLDPRFATVGQEDILAVVCGLRPVRATVRVALERPAPDRWLIHNYGHGGAGVTLSWGCAEEVAALVGTIE